MPEAETDAHGAGKEQDDVPGDLFQVIDVQQTGGKEENGRCQQHGGLMGRREAGHGGFHHGRNTQYQYGRPHDSRGNDFFFGDTAHLFAQPLGFLPQAGNGLFFRFHDHHEKAPQQKGHQPADGRHIVGQFKKTHGFPGDFIEKSKGDGATGGTQQGDDGTGTGDIGHTDEEAFPEFGRLVSFAVHGVDSHQQGVDGGRHGCVGHDVGQGSGENKTPQVDHAGFFTHNSQHFVCDAAGQPRFREDQANNDGAEDKQYAGVHEILEGIFGRADKEKYLQDPDGQAGHADGHHFEDPPGSGQQKYRQGTLAFRRKRKGFPFGI